MITGSLQDYKNIANKLLDEGKLYEAFFSFAYAMEHDDNYKEVFEKMVEIGILYGVNQDYQGMRRFINGFN